MQTPLVLRVRILDMVPSTLSTFHGRLVREGALLGVRSMTPCQRHRRHSGPAHGLDPLSPLRSRDSQQPSACRLPHYRWRCPAGMSVAGKGEGKDTDTASPKVSRSGCPQTKLAFVLRAAHE